HLGHGRGPRDGIPRGGPPRAGARVQRRGGGGVGRVGDDRYRPALEWALEWRYLTIALATSALLITVGVLAGGWLRFTFQERVEGDVLVADLTMAPGTTVEATAEAVRRIEEAARAVRAETDAERDLRHGSIFSHMLVSVGEQPFLQRQSEVPGMGRTSPLDGANRGEVQVEMIDPEHRDVRTETMMKRWRDRVGHIPGAVELTFVHSMVSAGNALELELRGGRLEQLRGAADAVKERLSGYDGVYDVRDSFHGGKRELRYRVLPSAESLGVSMADVARQVRQAFHGEEAQRIQRGRDEVKVMVRYPPEERRALADVETMHIRAPDGSELPFTSVAEAAVGVGTSVIRRVDRERVVTVTADVDLGVANPNEIVADLEDRVLPEVLAAFPGVQVGFEGEQAEQRDFLSAMARGQLVALVVIFALLAVPLGSYVQPLLIMSVIPFGLVGAVWGHVLLGYDFSMYSVIGLVALSGVVVNASLVLVDSVNRHREEGATLHEAVREAGRARFRAIWLTSITTFAGLTPMMLEQSTSSRFMIPTAIALAFGVVFASFITLFLVPCGYLVLEDLAALWARLRAPSATHAAPDPDHAVEEGATT
ncbi:MAG: efflux RND transporter permease subunit, partial [Myxococcota bacterium]|nr:efflux RND transporter permease subunit [Myxococcota bacterium]